MQLFMAVVYCWHAVPLCRQFYLPLFLLVLMSSFYLAVPGVIDGDYTTIPSLNGL